MITSYAVTQTYFNRLKEDNKLVYARVKNTETGEESLLEPYQIPDANELEEGDTIDYEVNLSKNNLFTREDLAELPWNENFVRKGE